MVRIRIALDLFPSAGSLTCLMSHAIEYWMEPRECCDSIWEEAYARFETPGQEVEKFLRRLRTLGVGRWSRELEVVEIF